MGREVRRVPANWQHPRDECTGRYKPLYPFHYYSEEASAFLNLPTVDALQLAIDEHEGAPDTRDYMPNWSESECTHYMMYETVTEGTPISPAFATPEDLAWWLVDNKASACGHTTAGYNHWLRVAKGGYAPTAVITSGGVLQSGVAGIEQED